jgi:hypothetical protein
LRAWYDRYSPRGFAIVGVHTPEFLWERSHDKVVEATRRLGVVWPVVQDNDYVVWRRFGVRAWPTALLVDKGGVVRYRHIGEGAYAETEALIQRLLAQDR